MGWETEIPDVVAGQPIESAWGNEIRDKLVHIVPTEAALPTDVPDGGLAYVEATDKLYVRSIDTWIRAGIAGVGTWYKNNAQASVPNNAAVTIQFNTVEAVLDPGSVFGMNLTNGALTVNRTGYYQVTAGVLWAANATGVRLTRITSTPIALAADAFAPGRAGLATGAVASRILSLTAGQTIIIQGLQDSGGTLDTVAGNRTFVNAALLA
jgi:hypothetical protein